VAERFWAWARLGKAGVKAQSELVTDSLATTTVHQSPDRCDDTCGVLFVLWWFVSCFGGRMSYVFVCNGHGSIWVFVLICFVSFRLWVMGLGNWEDEIAVSSDEDDE
jgi:hypothetical protein